MSRASGASGDFLAGRQALFPAPVAGVGESAAAYEVVAVEPDPPVLGAVVALVVCGRARGEEQLVDLVTEPGHGDERGRDVVCGRVGLPGGEVVGLGGGRELVAAGAARVVGAVPGLLGGAQPASSICPSQWLAVAGGVAGARWSASAAPGMR